MTDRQLFKFAFISRCLSHGDTTAGAVAERAEALCKQAQFVGAAAGLGASKAMGAGLDVAKDVAGTIWEYGMPLALAAPPVIGGAAGWALSKAMDSSEVDANEIKRQELIAEYKRQAGRLRRQGMLSAQGR